MRRCPLTFAGLVGVAAAVILAAPASARHRVSIQPPVFPIEHQVASAMAEQERPPYAMNYADEAAETLGVKGGRWEAFDTGSGSSSSDPFLPSLHGGVDGRGAMLRLQWR